MNIGKHRTPRPLTPSRWLLAALFGVFVLVLAACGEGNGTTDDDATAADPDPGEEAEADADPDEEDEAEPEAADEDADTESGDEVAEFFRDNQLTFVIARAPGGGMDEEGRIVAQYMAEELETSVIIDNQDGAGGMVANNNLFQVPPDGTTILQTFGENLVTAYLLEVEGMRYELGEFTYIGRLSADPYGVAVAADSPYETVDDLIGAEGFTFSAGGAGGGKHINTLLFLEALDIDGESVTGFESSGEEEVALFRGDVDAMVSNIGSLMPNIESGELRPLVIAANERSPALPDVPALVELDALSDESRALARAHTQLFEMGRAILAPPGVPQERVDFLRQAFRNVMENPEFLDAFERAGRNVSPMYGEEYEQQAQDLLNMPEGYLEILKQAAGAA